jgi:hypothetical protein
MMLIAIFNHQGIAHNNYASDGQTVNKEYYIKAIHKLNKQPALWTLGDWQLHHDNVPAHLSHFVQNFLADQIPQVLQPPYSMEMAPCDSFPFPKVKMLLKGNRFQDTEVIK